MDFNIFQKFIDRIDAAFPEKKIYVDHSNQKRELPSITIDTVQATMRREIRGRFWIDFIIEANYLPEDEANEFDIEDIKFKMAYALDRLPIDEKRYFQATRSEAKVIDRAIIGTAHYSVYFKEEATAVEFMETLEQEIVTTEEAWESREEDPELDTETKIPSENNNPKAKDFEEDLMGRLWRK